MFYQAHPWKDIIQETKYANKRSSTVEKGKVNPEIEEKSPKNMFLRSIINILETNWGIKVTWGTIFPSPPPPPCNLTSQ
jgi:hypothetical protein